MMHKSDIPEAAPQPGQTDVYPLVIADFEARNQYGIGKYGTPLQTFNGRDALMDAYQEAIDLAVYLRQKIEENKSNQELGQMVRDLPPLRELHHSITDGKARWFVIVSGGWGRWGADTPEAALRAALGEEESSDG